MKAGVRIPGVAAILGCVAACGSHDLPPPTGLLAGAGGSTCGACNVDGGTGGTGGGAVDGGSGVEASSPDLGSIVVVDIPNTSCTHTSAVPVTVMETEPLFITYDRAGVIGSRRFAVDSNTLAMMTFDADGLTPSPIVENVISAVRTPDERLATLTSDGTSLFLQLRDSSGNALGAGVTLASSPFGTPELAAGGQSILAVWQSDDHIVGRLASLDGQLGASMDLGANSCGAAICTVRAVYNGRDFTLVWSRTLQDERNKTSWAVVGTDGKLIVAKSLLLATGYHRLVDFVFIDSGYALLVGEGFPTRDAVLVFLDAFGNVTPPARRLLGSYEPWALAATTTGVLGVTASLVDGRGAMRPLSPAGDPLAGWVCVDDSPPDIGFSAHAAIHADGAGYGLVVRPTDGSALYLRTDDHGSAMAARE